MRKRGHIGLGLALLLSLVITAAVGCGGTDPGGTVAGDMAGGGGSDGGLALFTACTDNSQCQSGLCTMQSYDRSPTPICTYQCDANDMNPLCPMGCNPKGYCKKPN
jgi:hypothetical protein